jgi:hypothetical protein
MNPMVCIAANTIEYPEGGGHTWVYLNWALGLRSLGCRVIWLERLGSGTPRATAERNVSLLRNRLSRYGLAEGLAIAADAGTDLGPALANCLDLDGATEADLLVNLMYDLPEHVIRRFRRSVLLDIDPGLLQIWISDKLIHLASHDVYCTTGETVGQPDAGIPTCGIDWQYVAPCVALEHWPKTETPDGAPFTTVSHWFADEWVQFNGATFANDKRSGFLPFLDLPSLTSQSLELALCLGDDEEERRSLQRRGWHIQESATVCGTPWDYQRYIQGSRGEFSCVKPSCVKLQNAWISDRTICYLASGKPAVVQHTGPSRFLPEAAGLLRFKDLTEAASRLQLAIDDYPRQCELARDLTETFFSAGHTAGRVLECALN